MSKVKPLKKKTMTLSQLQLRVLDVIRKARFQFGREAWMDGMNDAEFIATVLEPLETDIYQDRKMLKMLQGAKQQTTKKAAKRRTK